MSRPPIVALLGVDGSGKTTQARLLAAWLGELGLPARYFENGGGRPVLDAIAHRLGRRDGIALLGRGHLVIEAALRWCAISRALALSRLTGRIAVMDRYAYCQFAIMRTRSDDRERRVRAFFRRFPSPDIVCLLSVPAETARERVELRGYDREELAHLIAFDAAYRGLPEAVVFHLVDAGGTVEEVQAALRAAVAAVLRR